MLWDDVLREVLERKANGQKTDLLNDDRQNYTKAKKQKVSGEKIIATYELGSQYGKIYFTKREAECMMWLLRGKTINSVAALLKLSPRTVEYYVKNMKTKVGCRTKFELIDLVYASEFMKNVGSEFKS